MKIMWINTVIYLKFNIKILRVHNIQLIFIKIQILLLHNQ